MNDMKTQLTHWRETFIKAYFDLDRNRKPRPARQRDNRHDRRLARQELRAMET